MAEKFEEQIFGQGIFVEWLISIIWSKVKWTLFISQIQLIIHCCFASIDESSNGGKGVQIVSIDDAEKTQYDERGLNQGAYNYGAEIVKNAQFNHQTRGPDGVTYGCFGYLDNDEKPRSEHYIADARGFRLLTSTELIEVFPVATEAK